jgi:hypothetical protein
LSLRGIARDLGVSHAALLAALSTDGWTKVKDATLNAADATNSTDPHVRLHAMGQGFMRWAFANRALYRTLLHPDVTRFADDSLSCAMREFTDAVRDAVQASQAQGRHPDVPLEILSLYTNAVPFGAAMLMINPLLSSDHPDLVGYDEEDLIEQVINLVVPL